MLFRSVRYGRVGVYFITIQNTGNVADAFNVTSSAITGSWIVNFFDAGGTKITRSVMNASWTTPMIPAGGEVMIRLELSPSSGIAVDASQQIDVTVRSVTNPSRADVVRATTTRVAR